MGSSLPELFIEGFDDDQIWQEIYLRNQVVLRLVDQKVLSALTTFLPPPSPSLQSSQLEEADSASSKSSDVESLAQSHHGDEESDDPVVLSDIECNLSEDFAEPESKKSTATKPHFPFSLHSDEEAEEDEPDELDDEKMEDENESGSDGGGEIKANRAVDSTEDFFSAKEMENFGNEEYKADEEMDLFAGKKSVQL